ncbi:MAG: LLM class F420-dependent oxidoreductase [Acidimicrobiales bacterium]|nr:LLM class F420-dependent oxidoreductase [Acidimicrobiales bacterium]
MADLKVGVQLHPQATTMAELREAWIKADSLGVDSLWTWDHFFPLYGDPEASHFECWSILAAMAATTSHATIGPMVTPMSYRNPDLLADIARTVDHISSGRVVLGMGSGWFERDYDEYGYEFGTAPGRLKIFGQELPRVVRRLENLNPPPMGPLPILIGGTGPKVTLRLTAQYAQMHNMVGKTPEQAKGIMATLDEWCEKLGKDSASIERTTMVEANADVEAWAEVGVRHLIYMAGNPYDLTEVERLLAIRDS